MDDKIIKDTIDGLLEVVDQILSFLYSKYDNDDEMHYHHQIIQHLQEDMRYLE